MEAEGGNTGGEIYKAFISQSWRHLQQVLTNEAITDPIKPSSLTSDLMKQIRKKILSLLYTVFAFT